jgi:hypothetical protein
MPYCPGSCALERLTAISIAMRRHNLLLFHPLRPTEKKTIDHISRRYPRVVRWDGAHFHSRINNRPTTNHFPASGILAPPITPQATPIFQVTECVISFDGKGG